MVWILQSSRRQLCFDASFDSHLIAQTLGEAQMNRRMVTVDQVLAICLAQHGITKWSICSNSCQVCQQTEPSPTLAKQISAYSITSRAKNSHSRSFHTPAWGVECWSIFRSVQKTMHVLFRDQTCFGPEMLCPNFCFQVPTDPKSSQWMPDAGFTKFTLGERDGRSRGWQVVYPVGGG